MLEGLSRCCLTGFIFFFLSDSSPKFPSFILFSLSVGPVTLPFFFPPSLRPPSLFLLSFFSLSVAPASLSLFLSFSQPGISVVLPFICLLFFVNLGGGRAYMYGSVQLEAARYNIFLCLFYSSELGFPGFRSF